MSTETYTYGEDHTLQTVTVTTFPEAPEGYWVILIHGGAWRDPTQTATSYLHPAASILTTNPTYAPTLPRIAGLASIEYRLSAHPSHPQDPSTDPHTLRNAKHPDHLHDVQSALAFLQQKYSFGERYVLVGHSCGATMAFQSVMAGLRGEGSAPGPVGILGVAGIYDLRLLRDTNADVYAYHEFIEGAFGPDEGVWDQVSPAVGGMSGWGAGRLVVLAQSPDDGLVDFRQGEVMKKALVPWVEDQGVGRRVEVLSIQGEHDEAWEKGEELARAIAFTLGKL